MRYNKGLLVSMRTLLAVLAARPAGNLSMPGRHNSKPRSGSLRRWISLFCLIAFCVTSCTNEPPEPTPRQRARNREAANRARLAALERRNLAQTRPESADDQQDVLQSASDSDTKLAKKAKKNKKSKQTQTAAVDDIFAGTNVLRFKIEVSPGAMDALRATRGMWGRRSGDRRPVVRATVREGGQVYTNVAIHLKGAAGSFREVDDDPALTLNFQKFAPGQSFHGYHKLSLNNSVQDPSFLTEKICRELFEASGVPAPHAGFAKVVLNDNDLGLHVMVEGFGKQFLKRNFKNTAGNLYDGGFLQDVDGRLELNSGDNPKDRSGLDALIKAARESDPTQRVAMLEKALDMDRFLSYVAMDIIQCDWDGYAMNRNNWRIFHDLESNKMVFFPHGLDQMFGVVRAGPDCRLLPPMQGMVARAVLSIPDLQRRYYARMSELYKNVFHVDAILKRVDELAAVIHPVIAESGRQLAEYHNAAVQNLKERISERDQYLKVNLPKAAVQQLPGVYQHRFRFQPPDPGDAPNPQFFRLR